MRTVLTKSSKPFISSSLSSSFRIVRRHQETRRYLFGFGNSSSSDSDDNVERVDKLFKYMKKLEREGRIGNDDLLLEILKSHNTLESVDNVLIDRLEQLASSPPREPVKTDPIEETNPEKSYKDIGNDTKTTSFNADSGTGQPGLTYEQALQVEKEALDKLASTQPRMALMAIKNMPGVSLGMRWQQMNGVLLGTQLQCITPLGFSNDQAGILAYTNYCASFANSPENKELKDLMMKRWDYAMEHAFGVTEKKPMTVDTARSYTKDLFEGVSDTNFLDRLNAIFEKYGDIKPDDMGEAMKLQAELFPLMFEIQTSVAEKYGYVGDQEYVMAQRALMDHSTDPMVFENTQKMHQVLFSKFGM